MFLTPEEVAELTGIKKGKDKRTREQLQIQQLCIMGVPHFVNARGAPKIARSFIDTRKEEKQKPTGWTPAVLKVANG